MVWWLKPPLLEPHVPLLALDRIPSILVFVWYLKHSKSVLAVQKWQWGITTLLRHNLEWTSPFLFPFWIDWEERANQPQLFSHHSDCSSKPQPLSPGQNRCGLYQYAYKLMSVERARANNGTVSVCACQFVTHTLPPQHPSTTTINNTHTPHLLPKGSPKLDVGSNIARQACHGF